MRVAPVVLVAAAACSGAPTDPADPPREASAGATAVGSAGPVVLELFTSQGCSSCPPADRYLASLSPGEEVAGRPVIPLSFHVDYWNDLGWADPFASEAWSERQRRYARLTGAGRVYTPAIVVAGRRDAVGSRRGDVEALIAAAPPTAPLDATARRDGDRVVVHATPPAGATAWAAVVEDDLVTAVGAGENAGATLRSDHVVRALVALDGGAATIDVDPRWRATRVVVFAQEPGGAIVAAAAR